MNEKKVTEQVTEEVAALKEEVAGEATKDVPVEVKEEASEVKSAKAQLELVSEWVSEEFYAVVIKQAQIREMYRMLSEKRHELEATINECSLRSDLDGLISANSTLQALKMISAEPIPEIPKDAAEKAIQAVRSAVLHSKTLTERSFPTAPINLLLMLGRQHELQHATKNELTGRHEYNEFEQTIYAWRNRLSGWMHKSITDPFQYLLEGYTIIAHDNAVIQAEAERVSEIVKKGNADFRDLHKTN